VPVIGFLGGGSPQLWAGRLLRIAPWEKWGISRATHYRQRRSSQGAADSFVGLRRSLAAFITNIAESDFRYTQPHCLSPASVPMARKEVLRHHALDIIGQAPARPDEEAGDVLIGLLLTRLKDAPQNAGLVFAGHRHCAVARARVEKLANCREYAHGRLL
jgi:hypothetical protein